MTRSLAIIVALACTGCAPPLPPPPMVAAPGVVVVLELAPVAGGAHAHVDPAAGRCTITLDQARLPRHSAVVWFALWHELAHCSGIVAEADADCWAIDRMAAAGMLSATSLLAIVAWLQDRRASPVHPTGAARAARALECAP